MSERAVAELIVHLGRIAYADSGVGDLTPAQWVALRYFTSANRFSRTPSAFAEYHGTTRGTASQIIKSLVALGHLSQTRSECDGRSTRLELTDQAKAILADDPFQVLVEAVGALSQGTCDRLASNLQRVLSHIANERGKQPFGTCETCDHLDGADHCQLGGTAYRCRYIGEPLVEVELEQLCINYTSFGAPRSKRRA